MSRHRHPLRYRKSAPTESRPRDGFSQSLRAMRNLVHGDRAAEALSQIDGAIGQGASVPQTARLLSLAADSLVRQGKFDEAAHTFARTTAMSSDESEAWVRPWIGEVQALLKSAQAAAAADRATALVAHSVEAERQFRALAAKADSTLRQGGQVEVPSRPPRTSVIASRLGQIFLLEGEVADARKLFESALQLNPNGATRARLGLAEVSLRQGDAPSALRLTKEAMRLGKFKAKTLSGWALLFAASRHTGADPLDASLLSGLAQAVPSVQARATLLIVRQLREQNDGRWQTLARQWLEGPGPKSAVVTAELRKLLLASGRLLREPTARRLDSAHALLRTPGLGPMEWLSGAKQFVTAQRELGQVPDWDGLISRGPEAIRPALIHSLALVAQKSGAMETALSLFNRNLKEQPAGSAAWGKAATAAGRILRSRGRAREAADLYWSLYQQPATTERFRLYSLVEWARVVSALQTPSGEIQAQIAAAYPHIRDYETVLDLARQVRQSAFRGSLSDQMFERGQQLAWQALETATHPGQAASVLHKFSRRANDFLAYDAILETWTRQSESRRQWLWSPRSDYWSWIELVFRAYRDSKNYDAAEPFARQFLSDPAIPPEGYALLGASFAALKVRQSDFTAAFAVYDRMSQVAPSYEWTSAAYYWQALRAWKSGERAGTVELAERILSSLGSDLGLNWKKDMAASAWCLRAELNLDSIAQPKPFQDEVLRRRLAKIQSDLARLTL